MKRLFLGMIVALMIMQTVTCETAQYYFPLSRIEPMIGNWYDSKGNLALTIKNGYTINGCKVLELEIIRTGYVGITYKIKILEQTGERDIMLCYHEYRKSNGGHEFIQIGEQSFIRTKIPQYYESIGGLYLGINKDKVLALYGQPSKIDDYIFDISLNHSTWIYDKLGLELKFAGDIVSDITIYPNSNLRFERSGLSVNDSMEAYKKFYRADKIYEDRSFVIYIGHGESFLFDRRNGSVTLSIY